MSEPAHILMTLTNGYTHDPRVAAEASSLTRAGYRVTVLGWDREGTLPPEEALDGVHVVRVRSTLAMKLRRYEVLRLRPFWRLALRRALALHAATPFAAVHCHDLDTMPVGVRLKKRYGLPLVYDVHEIFPYLVELSRARPWVPRFAKLEQRLAPRADLVIAAGEPHRDYLSPIARAPVIIVTNSKPVVYDGYEPPPTKRMKVLYLGGLETFRLLEPLAQLAVEDSSFEVDIGGTGPLADRIRLLAARARGNLRYLGLVPMHDVLPLTRAADIVFSVFDPAKRINQIGVPNKFFEALAAGRPVLVSRGTWIGRAVETADCGLAIDYSKEALRKVLNDLQADPALRERLGRNAFRLARERYNWAREEAVLLRAYRDLIVPSSAAG